MSLQTVNYDELDKAKLAFIEASKQTMKFAERFGFVPDNRLGASANIFNLDLRPFIKAGAENLYITLLPEGLGTADDARPNDLTESELKTFWHNIGIKTVSCLTNDAASSGIQTILIGLYLPSSTPELVFDNTFLKGFLDGFVDGCKTVGCVWISGETPQLKTKILEGKLDIAGCLFGMTPPGREPIDGTKLKAGNKIVFVESSGPHENGFTSLRSLAGKLKYGYRTKLPNGQEFWQAINAPSVLYTPLVQNILNAGIKVTAIENMTGHGWQKIMRSKKQLRYVVEQMLPVTPVFQFVEEAASMSKVDMLKIFNYGVGCTVFVEDDDAANAVVKSAKDLKLNAAVAGTVENSDSREVVIKPLGITIKDDSFVLQRG